jgi:signal transduction histidine kinase
MNANKPKNDQERIHALHRFNILDTPKEEDYDAITRLAASICGAPISVINLIDLDRQWFKSEVGLGVRETPLATSLCAHAILEQEILVIPDTREDCRFSDNPLVTSNPGLRAYAGALLKTEDGFALGTLCVLDYKPRQWTQTEIDAIRVLARQVMTQLEFRLLGINLNETNRALTESLVQQEAQLKDAAQDLEAFCYALAHDIRTPVRNIIFETGMALDDLEPEVREAVGPMLRKISEETGKIAALASDLIELTSIGRMELKRTSVDLGQIVATAAEQCQELYGRKVEISLGADLVAYADAKLIGRVVIELVHNAFEHSDPSRVLSISVSKDPGLETTFHIKDNGMGFNEAFMSRLFKPFERLDNREGGTGLGMGLAKAKRIVERHSGTIWAEGKPGVGATFSFSLPGK